MALSMTKWKQGINKKRKQMKWKDKKRKEKKTNEMKR